MVQKVKERVKIEDILMAHNCMKDIVIKTPLQRDTVLSEKYDCDVYVKREDLQLIRSFKIRGAYNLIQSLPKEKLQNGVVCASAGNHAQGVAYTCNLLKIPSKIFMPTTTPKQKVSQVQFFGGDFAEIVLVGDTFDSSFQEAQCYCEENRMTFVHPFDDPYVVAGQGTVAVEIMHDMEKPVDYIFTAIGGGGLASGVGTYVKGVSPTTKVIGVEPMGAASMKEAFLQNENVALEKIDSFVDGAAVKKVGKLTFETCKDVIDDIILVPEGKVCTTILELYKKNAIVAEPAGALSIAALDLYRDEIKGKTVVCTLSGGNNDIDRMQEMKERSLIYEGLKHYFIIEFPQRSGALREFLDKGLGPEDDIMRFEYIKKHNKENGPALVGVELKHKEDYEQLITRFKENNIQFMELNKNPVLFDLLI
ncbi:threonine ammonia-lyase IlvA [Bacillus thuringiensis]|jgi:threonine dehydratase|uniref:threonine ammonia-lyase IlvA n=1 Tax=Bacillus thuringiensis TaxID=1428 RepID=UPI001580F476|nr:threonine ammonia-lyase IlvA [Bacillus thuringiensis]NUH87645.1 threonine ammonia-lyase IlvA [Bacillus thuringiensis]NUH93244.1 threonine ammonia-lyase IlvA [Bacillus thuringiensis]NUH97989.1 threonine ammonia-lyase IlvA [Bacillus thuringiensis]NUI04772.1 threonine ammonia-lyase IlvA [Bacillus thuringiensis]NUI12748.1 threonine ammonia-lyase IlvA [Bacillus thuringiensis]